MLLKSYLIVYFAVVACAVLALWQGNVLARLPIQWVVLVVAAAMVLGVLLAIVSRNTPANPA